MKKIKQEILEQIDKLINEKRYPISGKTPIGMKFNKYRGITYLIIDEGQPPDVHGLPKDFEAYGRGWETPEGNIEIDGGPAGSSQGHPTTAKNGFYWGVDQDAAWKNPQTGETEKGIAYIRGRAGTPEKWLDANKMTILNMMFRRIPKP